MSDTSITMPMLHTPPLSLPSYLTKIRSSVFRYAGSASPSTGTTGSVSFASFPPSSKPIVILGNPSCDLDSFVSATVLSYFYNHDQMRIDRDSRYYVPVLNLPDVKSQDLWRLRPEFGAALRLALDESEKIETNGTQSQEADASGGKDVEKGLLEQLVTLKDILSDEKNPLYSIFKPSSEGQNTVSHATNENEHEQNTRQKPPKQEIFLVDHNIPSIPIPRISASEMSSRLEVVGIIDHHVDEHYKPPSPPCSPFTNTNKASKISPHIIAPGHGSCTSLVIQHLQSTSLFPPSTPKLSTFATISRLALSAILIDTSNLRAKGDKCSDLDRDMVAFLESQLPTGSGWDREKAYQEIKGVKDNSLELLNSEEILGRDYKEWIVTSERDGEEIKDGGEEAEGEVVIGVPSMVRSICWLITHAGSASSYLSSLQSFATSSPTERKLDVFCLLTRTEAGDKEVVLISASPERTVGVVKAFEQRAQEELQLEENNSEILGTEMVECLDQWAGKEGLWKAWYMRDLSKSRKQVVPILRDVIRESLQQ